MIDINELRRRINWGDKVATGVAIELLDRLEAAEGEVESIRQGISFRDDVVAALAVERDALRAKIEAVEKQEPVGTLHDDGCFVWRKTAPHESNYAGWKMALYALPGAKGEEK